MARGAVENRPVLGSWQALMDYLAIDMGQLAHERVRVLYLNTQNRLILDHLASELFDIEVMDSDHLKRILDEHTTGPQIKPGTFVAPSVAEEPEPEPAVGDESGAASGA